MFLINTRCNFPDSGKRGVSKHSTAYGRFAHKCPFGIKEICLYQLLLNTAINGFCLHRAAKQFKQLIPFDGRCMATAPLAAV